MLEPPVLPRTTADPVRKLTKQAVAEGKYYKSHIKTQITQTFSAEMKVKYDQLLLRNKVKQKRLYQSVSP